MSLCSRKGLYATSAIGIGISLLLYAFRENLLHAYESTAAVIEAVANFEVAGFFVPWRYVFPCLLAGCLFLYWKLKRRSKAKSVRLTEVDENKPVLISGKTLLEIHTAKENIKELTRRLEVAEKTTHLVMKQLEAVTKCLAQVLEDDKSKPINNNDILNSSIETEL